MESETMLSLKTLDIFTRKESNSFENSEPATQKFVFRHRYCAHEVRWLNTLIVTGKPIQYRPGLCSVCGRESINLISRLFRDRTYLSTISNFQGDQMLARKACSICDERATGTGFEADCCILDWVRFFQPCRILHRFSLILHFYVLSDECVSSRVQCPGKNLARKLKMKLEWLIAEVNVSIVDIHDLHWTLIRREELHEGREHRCM